MNTAEHFNGENEPDVKELENVTVFGFRMKKKDKTILFMVIGLVVAIAAVYYFTRKTPGK